MDHRIFRIRKVDHKPLLDGNLYQMSTKLGQTPVSVCTTSTSYNRTCKSKCCLPKSSPSVTLPFQNIDPSIRQHFNSGMLWKLFWSSMYLKLSDWSVKTTISLAIYLKKYLTVKLHIFLFNFPGLVSGYCPSLLIGWQDTRGDWINFLVWITAMRVTRSGALQFTDLNFR